jgi:hypothetical protein
MSAQSDTWKSHLAFQMCLQLQSPLVNLPSDLENAHQDVPQKPRRIHPRIQFR